MPDVRLSPRAERDLDDIWLNVARDSSRAADALVDRLGDRIRLLADSPRAGAARSDIAPDARVLVVGSYLVLYRLMASSVEVVAIVHGACDLTDLR